MVSSKIKRLSIILVFCLSGCVNMSDTQRAMDKIDETWGVTNGNLLKTSGTKEYRVSKSDAFRAMYTALTELGFIVMNQDLETGIILAKAPIPTPLSKNEWNAVKEVEEPKMQAIVTPVVGSLLANMFVLVDTNFNVILNVILLEKQENLQISLRVQTEYTGSTVQMVYGHQPPPEELKYAINKIWDTFERVMFIQKGTFK